MALYQFQSTPLVRGETRNSKAVELYGTFQSTPLMRGETRRPDGSRSTDCISTHSPHARGDFVDGSILLGRSDFNPLPSCEGRQKSLVWRQNWIGFQSTPFMRGETCIKQAKLTKPSDFNPLPSCEGRRFYAAKKTPGKGFQSTPLMRGETRLRLKSKMYTPKFQSTPLMRGETFRAAV